MSKTEWGMGCKNCAYTGEEFLIGVSSGDGWTGRPCPYCVEGGEFYIEDDPPTAEPASKPQRYPQPALDAILQPPRQCQVEADGDMVWA